MKAKDKLIFIIKLTALIILGIFAAFGIFILFDTVLNGLFLDIIANTFFINKSYEDKLTGDMIYYREPLWGMIKSFILNVFFILVIFYIVTVFFISHAHGKKEKKKCLTQTGQMIQTYMSNEVDANAVFPLSHAEISTQIVELKSAMNRQTQTMKEEINKKNDLITYLAHDLKTPLTSIIGYLSLLEEAPDMPESQKEKYIGITLDKSLRLEKLINEFFEVTRYNFQDIILEKETIDLSYMLVQITDEFYPLLSAHGNHGELQVEEHLSVYGDSMKLARVFNNILKNAIAYSYADTPIKIWAGKKPENGEEKILICFMNHGKTIPAERLDSLFEKFYRLDSARASNTGGAGLGLAIAKEIVSLHGGSISAESQDELTTFQVILPVHS